jgi:hypothetical protein
MNTESAPAHREPVLATILLFPFRAVERTKGTADARRFAFSRCFLNP